MNRDENIEVFGARVHNLKNIDVVIPRNQLVVITGLSGSGKSSLAFDTIYAEGQRRYIESFSAYARQFLGTLERPDVDDIKGLSPVIAIEQKTVNKNPRSTVGTITEIYDFLRLLFAKASDAYSYVTGEKMVKYTDDQIIEIIGKNYQGKKVIILAPVVKGRKGHYRELFEQIAKQGFLKVRIDGNLQDITLGMKVDRYKTHDIEIVIDKIVVGETAQERLVKAIQLAMAQGKGSMMILDIEENKVSHFSRQLMCPTSGISYDEPAPNLFSFNSPYGACPDCNGLGEVMKIDTKKIIPNPKLSIKKGGFLPLGEYRNNWIFNTIERLLKQHGFDLNTPIEDIDDNIINALLYGTEEILHQEGSNISNAFGFEGIANFIIQQAENAGTKSMTKWAESFMHKITCKTCNGKRLKQEALFFKIDNQNIADLSMLSLENLKIWVDSIEKKLENKQKIIAKEILKEIRTRLGFLLDVGLNYLTLNRPTSSLSGGEAQRIRLATQIGSQLVGVLYILDEPSIGLHQRDNVRLINALKNLRDIGNSVLVVEHDQDMILNADYVLDVGPAAGVHGGRIVAQGTPKELLQLDTPTTNYLNGSKKIKVPTTYRKGNDKVLTLHGAKGNNLKNITVSFPLGKFICVTGVSGSGKSTLINETLHPILSQHIYQSDKAPLAYDKIEGIEHIDKVIKIDQSPIGRTPRSNPATYTNVFTDIRNLFAELPEAKIRGYKPGRFSFNVKGGRCEECQGGGMKVIEMNFLPDVYVPCEACQGKRYNRETLEVRYKGKSISDILNMTIENAVPFFENIPNIARKLKTIADVGLGYITLGQQATTLSGGEAQRIKLATELSKKDTGNTFYILDEPTTGLHFQDIDVLLSVLHQLVDKGNTVLVIEHNLDVIKTADYIIDIGPEAGEKGGYIVFEGSPIDLLKVKQSYTASFLKPLLNQE